MRVFVTGASGWIGSALVPELLAAGHTVVGLARSDASAARIEALGAEVLRGSLEDLESLRTGAADADGVAHLGFVHDFANFDASIATDRRAIATFGDVLAGTGKPLAIASGFAGFGADGPITEADHPSAEAFGRAAAAAETLALADRGVRSSVVRLAPTVHGAGDHGFVATLVAIARERGVSGYPGDGENRWPAVHVSDAARLFRLAVESAPAGSVLHAVAEEGVPVKRIAEVVGAGLDLPVRSSAVEDFGWLGRFLAADMAATSDRTRGEFGWEPTGPELLDDVADHYLAAPAAR